MLPRTQRLAHKLTQRTKGSDMKQINIEYHLDRHVITIDGHDYDSRVMTLKEARKRAEGKK
jgi:hypothetical protein